MVRPEVSDRYIVVDFETPRHVLTTAHPKGLVVSSRVAIYRVSEGDDLSKPEDFKEAVRSELGLDRDDPVMLTAADLRDYRYVRSEGEGVIATVGLSNPACHNMHGGYTPLRPSTINVVAWTSEKLTVSGMLDLFRVISEAKAAAASDLLLRCEGRATGTVSDAVAVASFLDDNGYLWAGQATSLGSRLASMTYQAITARPPTPEEMLVRALGMGVEDLVEDAMKLYEKAPVPGYPPQVVRPMVLDEIRRELRDPNVVAFLIAARELDIHGASGTIPGVTAEEFSSDTKKVIADELLATSLSLYINGFKALTATYWSDTLKEKLGLRLSSLPMFEDDIASALAASALSRVYDRLLQEVDERRSRQQ